MDVESCHTVRPDFGLTCKVKYKVIDILIEVIEVVSTLLTLAGASQ